MRRQECSSKQWFHYGLFKYCVGSDMWLATHNSTPAWARTWKSFLWIKRFHFNSNIFWSDRKHCMQWNCTPEIVYSELCQQEKPRCNCVLSCIFVLKSICYSFIMLNFEINLLYRLKISMLSNNAGDFSFATQRDVDMFGSRNTQWWLHHCFEFTRNLKTSHCVYLLPLPLSNSLLGSLMS